MSKNSKQICSGVTSLNIVHKIIVIVVWASCPHAQDGRDAHPTRKLDCIKLDLPPYYTKSKILP